MKIPYKEILERMHNGANLDNAGLIHRILAEYGVKRCSICKVTI